MLPGVVAAVTLQVDSPVAITAAWTASPNAERYRIEWIGPGGTFNAPSLREVTDNLLYHHRPAAQHVNTVFG